MLKPWWPCGPFAGVATAAFAFPTVFAPADEAASPLQPASAATRAMSERDIDERNEIMAAFSLGSGLSERVDLAIAGALRTVGTAHFASFFAVFVRAPWAHAVRAAVSAGMECGFRMCAIRS